MSTKTLAVAVIGAGCIAAASAAGYVALRQNAADARLASLPAGPPETASATPAGTPTPASDPAATTPASSPADNAVAPAAPTPSLPIAVTPTPSGKAHAAAPTHQPARAHDPVVAPPVDAPPPPPPPAETPLPAAMTPPPPATDAPPPPPVPDPPAPRYEEVTVRADSVIGIRVDTTVSSETAKVEDRVNAHVARDVMVGGRTAIPAGAKLEGVVTAVERGGKFKGQARIGVRFNTLILADSTRVPIQTDTIFREGEAPGNASTSKVGGGAVLGAILGAVIGGKKGAIVGTTAGAGAGAAAVAAGDASQAVIAAGSSLTVRLTNPATITIERE